MKLFDRILQKIANKRRFNLEPIHRLILVDNSPKKKIISVAMIEYGSEVKYLEPLQGIILDDSKVLRVYM